MKNNNSDISNVRSNQILKEIFSNLSMIHILKLIKYKKKLQKRLEITKDIYEKNSKLPKFEITNKFLPSYDSEVGLSICIIINSLSFVLFYIYFFIYTILLVSLNGFDENNIKENSENSIKIVNAINKSLFALDSVMIISFILTRCCIYERYENRKKILNKIFLIFIVVIYVAFEVLIIWKLVLEYKIKKIAITWFIRMDISILVFYSIMITCKSCETFAWIKGSCCEEEHKTFCYLKSINNIMIKHIKLPDNFESFRKKEQMDIIFEHCPNIKTILNSPKFLIMIENNINKKRLELGLEPIKFESIFLPFMAALPSEAFFSEYRKIFIVGKNKYLFLCTMDELKNKSNKIDFDLMKIINNRNLSSMNLINGKDEEKFYIYFWGTNNNINDENIKVELKTKETEKIEINPFIYTNSELRLMK